MKTLAFFNNKGGVGTTSLAYHMSWMFAELGVSVVSMDLDPQSNLTASFLEDDDLEMLWEPGEASRTILGKIRPVLDSLGDIADSGVIEVHPRIGLVPGDLGLSVFEDRLAEAWGKCLDDNRANAADAFRVTTAFYRVMERASRQRNAELVLIDVGPNLGAINRACPCRVRPVLIPLAADLYSLQGLRNLGPTLRDWRNGWKSREHRASQFSNLLIPSGDMHPIGYVVMQPSVRQNYPVKAYQRWISRIPAVYRTEVVGRTDLADVDDPDPLALATLRNYRSLAPMAEEAHKPMFALKPADGAIGGHAAAVQDCYRVFRQLAIRIADECGLGSLVSQFAPQLVDRASER